MRKHHETKIDKAAWKIISCTKIRACTLKNIAQNRWHFTYFYTLLFIQTKGVFKFNPISVDILYRSRHNLLTFQPFDCWYSADLKVHRMPLSLFLIRTGKFLLGLNVLFLRFSASKCSYHVLIFHEILLTVNGENISWRYMLCKSYTLLCMLDVTFGCLIMASTYLK